jgi:hypothetical protein
MIKVLKENEDMHEKNYRTLREALVAGCLKKLET